MIVACEAREPAKSFSLPSATPLIHLSIHLLAFVQYKIQLAILNKSANQ